jgi:type I restriction enzyme R subunit
MIVANKFQTGFDQPYLVAMYVDKRLDGVTAVQTLSRLNRTAPGKDTTYVVDFVNDPETIVAAFKPYYEEAALSATTDPDLIHDLRNKLDAAHIYTDAEVDAVAAAWVADSGAPKAHERLIGLLSEPKVRFSSALDDALAREDRAELERLQLFRKDVDTYVKLYDFLSQVIDYGQTDLEKRAVFFRLFARLIRDDTRHESIDLSDVVLANIAHKAGQSQRLDLGGEKVLLEPLGGAGSGAAQDPVLVALAEVIRRMNEVFDGGSFDDTDIGALSEHVVRRMLDNPVVRAQVAANTQQHVTDSPALKAGFVDALVEAQEAYQDLVKQLFEGEEKRAEYFFHLIPLLFRTAEQVGDAS